jgi:hypothetical protein
MFLINDMWYKITYKPVLIQSLCANTIQGNKMEVSTITNKKKF